MALPLHPGKAGVPFPSFSCDQDLPVGGVYAAEGRGSIPQLLPNLPFSLPSIPLIQFLPSPVTSPWLNTMGTFSQLDFPFLDLRLPLELLPSLALSASYWVSSHLLAVLSLLLAFSAP